MDFFHNPNQQKLSPKYNNKKRLTQEQVRLLERSFTINKKLDQELKNQLSNQLGVPPRQVAIWYQNKRARWKTQSLELDYNTLQVKLENAVTDKSRLEKEVSQLREELRKAQGIVFAYNQGGINIPHHLHHHYNPPIPITHPLNNVSCNSSCDEGSRGSSSLHDDVNGEVLQLGELYACLIGSGGAAGSTWS